MSRSVPWRRTCPDRIGERMDEALRATVYILHQPGPTGFVLKEETSEKKLKVLLGESHSCSCSAFKKEKDLCLHILWVLLKRFRVPRENPLSFQLGLVEREISEVLRGHLRKQHSETDQSNPDAGSCDLKATRKEIGAEDVCPICQEELLGRPLPLTFCKFGCGNSVHIKCMKIWAEHQQSNGETTIRCPLCRENFGSIQDLPHERSSRLLTQRSTVHLGVTCSSCHVLPISGRCYRCTLCPRYHLCQGCFTGTSTHAQHAFEFRQRPGHPWRPATRLSSSATATFTSSSNPAVSSSLSHNLQNRSLTESDYELLLQLDQPAQATLVAVPEGVINSLPVEPLEGFHPLLRDGTCCQVCSGVYQRGDWVRKLPCKHKFHRACIDNWLRSGHSTCPIDGQPVARHRPSRRQKGAAAGATEGSKGWKTMGPLSQALSHQNSCGSVDDLEFTVSGQSIGVGSSRSSRLRGKMEGSVSSPHQPKPAKAAPKQIHRAHSIHPTPSAPRDNRTTAVTQLPRISNVGLCSRKKIVESSKRLLLRRQSQPPPATPGEKGDGSSTSPDQDGPSLAPICSGYLSHVTKSGSPKGTVPLPSVGSHSPPTPGRLRRGSLANKPTRKSSGSYKDPELDSSLHVSSFKLCPLAASASLITVPHC